MHANRRKSLMTASENWQVAIYGFSTPKRIFENAGLSYEVRVIRDKLSLRKCTLPVYKLSPVAADTTDENGDLLPGELRKHLFDSDGDKYEKFLFKLDPNDTKNQDHYKVLGLSKLRWQATPEEIRYCYRQKVLKHHPDKKKHKGIVVEREDYYTCITKAYEQIGVSEDKRKAFDSVDHKFNESIPSEKSINHENFFNELSSVFELNGRWSNVQPVPKLGKMDSTREDVDRFYDFWFNFSSWREFSYLDEEDKERGEDRYERREMEKQNKAERERRRKEEAKRIRKLVDIAYTKDPRIVKFRREEAAKKEFAKEERKRVQREKQEAIDKEKRDAEEKIRKEKEEEDRRLKEEREKEKKEKDILRKALATQRKRFRRLAEAAGFWTENARQKLTEMERVERICLLLQTDDLNELCTKIESIELHEDIREAVIDAEDAKRAQMVKPEDKGKENTTEKVQQVIWTSDEIQLLVKASNTYPPGTVDRWLIIGDFINEHRKDKTTPAKTEKQVIKQCKAVQMMNVKLPETAQNQLGTALPDEDTWSASEQKSLEEAIKKIPSSDPERWEKISTAVGTKSKKACIRRFKYLVQMVKNKK